MIEEYLLKELSEASNKVGGVTFLPREKSEKILKTIADIYITDRSSRWWWSSLSKKSKRISYKRNDGLSALRDLINIEDQCFLVVTDDEFPPWPIYFGRIDRILEILSECRYFEYFLAAENNEWVVFDTHHNELVVSGRLIS